VKQENDDDVKIVPEDISTLFAPQKPADANVDALLRERGLGNTGRAYDLGAQLAHAVLEERFKKAPPQVAENDFSLQMRLLFSYAVQRVLQDESPNGILANTALSGFHETVERASPEFHRALNESAALSLYFYLYHAGRRDAHAIAKQFADLCGVPGDAACEREGASAYDRFAAFCADAIRAAGYRGS
jgi:hypothetical protein